jgi:hypothetical protein
LPTIGEGDFEKRMNGRGLFFKASAFPQPCLAHYEIVVCGRKIARGERALIQRLSSGEPTRFYPFSLVGHGQITLGTFAMSLNALHELIGIGLLLVAALYLSRPTIKSHTQHAA